MEQDSTSAIISISIAICNTLRGTMLEYCKRTDRTHRSDILMDFIRRIECNVYAAAVLARESGRHKGNTYLKLPMGLVLRNCFIDSVYAFYLLELSDEEFEEEVSILNRDYVKSFKYRKPIFRDNVKGSGVEEEADLLYSLSIEDTFFEYLSFDDKKREEGIWPCIMDKDIRKTYSKKLRSTDLTKIYVYLSKICESNSLIERLYGYYKYFSQYEHFSEYSHGDSLAPWGEDNVSWYSALMNLKEATEHIVAKVMV